MKCRQCRKKVPAFAKECPYCHAPMEIKEKEVEKYLEQITIAFEKEEEREQRREKRIHRRKKKRIPIVFNKHIKVAMAAFLIIVIISGVLYEKGMRQWKLDNQTVAYLTEDRLVTADLETGKKLKLTSFQFSNYAEYQRTNLFCYQREYYFESKKENCIYYVYVDAETLAGESDVMSIYKQDCSSRYAKAELIADEVLNFVVDQNENIYYITRASETVTKYDGEKKQEISVPGLSRIIYNKVSDQVYVSSYDNTQHLMGSYSDSVDDVTTISKLNWENLSADKLFDTIGYMEELSGEKNFYYMFQNILYSYEISTGKVEEIAKNVQKFSMERDGEKELLYYNQYTLTEHSYYDFVIDRYAKEDALGGKKDENASKREAARQKMKEESLSTMKSVLYCYEDGVSTKVAEDACNPCQQYGDYNYDMYISWFSKQKQIKHGYEMSCDGTDIAEYVDQYYENYTAGEDIRFEFLYDWEKEEVSLPKKVIYAQENEDLYLKDKRIINYEEVFKPLFEQMYIKTVDDITYYYDWKEECLKRKSALPNKGEDVLARKVFAYQVFDDGTLVYMASKGNGKQYDLYKVDKEGEEELIANNVWGLLGKDIYYVESADRLDEISR